MAKTTKGGKSTLATEVVKNVQGSADLSKDGGSKKTK